MRQQRAYRYRCYPTPAQANVLARTFGCARFVYNWALRLRTDAYYERHERVSYADTSAALTLLKREPATAWLNEVSSVPTQQALAKMEAPLPIRWSRPLPEGATPSTVTVTCDAAGRYFVSLLVEEEIAPLPPAPTPAVGLDLGLHDVVILHTGEKVGNPRFFRKDAKRLAKAQRRLAKKQPESKNRAKARRTVARIHARIADRRRDFLHQLSTHLIRENQTICIESLHVKAMVKHPTLAQAISDVGWGELVRQLTYKAAWYGRTLVAIDKWYPSSKRRSSPQCGHVLGSLSLDTRSWTCPECGVLHDRDVNAAKNVLAAGLAVSACGEAVRPGRVRHAAPDAARLAEAGIPRL